MKANWIHMTNLEKENEKLKELQKLKQLQKLKEVEKSEKEGTIIAKFKEVSRKKEAVTKKWKSKILQK